MCGWLVACECFLVAVPHPHRLILHTTPHTYHTYIHTIHKSHLSSKLSFFLFLFFKLFQMKRRKQTPLDIVLSPPIHSYSHSHSLRFLLILGCKALLLFSLGALFSLIIDHLQTQHNVTKYPGTATATAAGTTGTTGNTGNPGNTLAILGTSSILSFSADSSVSVSVCTTTYSTTTGTTTGTTTNTTSTTTITSSTHAAGSFSLPAAAAAGSNRRRPRSSTTAANLPKFISSQANQVGGHVGALKLLKDGSLIKLCRDENDLREISFYETLYSTTNTSSSNSTFTTTTTTNSLIPFIPQFYGRKYLIKEKLQAGKGSNTRVTELLLDKPQLDEYYKSLLAEEHEIQLQHSTDNSGCCLPTFNSNQHTAKKRESPPSIQCIHFENIASSFKSPCIMDLKIGRRHYADWTPLVVKTFQKFLASVTTSAEYALRIVGFKTQHPATNTLKLRKKEWGVSLSKYVNGFFFDFFLLIISNFTLRPFFLSKREFLSKGYLELL